METALEASQRKDLVNNFICNQVTMNKLSQTILMVFQFFKRIKCNFCFSILKNAFYNLPGMEESLSQVLYSEKTLIWQNVWLFLKFIGMAFIWTICPHSLVLLNTFQALSPEASDLTACASISSSANWISYMVLR